MEKKLILKAKISANNEKKIQCCNSKNKWEMKFEETLQEIIATSFMRDENYNVYQNIMLYEFGDYENIKELIKLGFTVRIDESDDKFNLIISKNTSSISFSEKKEQGIASLLAQAEEWAETLLEDLKVNTACGL